MTSSRITVPLIGRVLEEFRGNKLPSRGEVLRNVMFELNCRDSNLRDAAYGTLKKLSLMWEKAGLATKPKHHSVKAIEKLYSEWRSVRKHESKRTQRQIKKETDFQSSLDDLFDISHENVMKLCKIEEDKEFLKMQRLKGRPGYMTKLDVEYAARQAARTARRKRVENRTVATLKRAASDDQASISSSSESEVGKKGSGSSSDEYCPPNKISDKIGVASVPGTSGLSPPRKKIRVSTDLAAALDATGQSDRKATRVLQQAAKCMGGSSKSFAISRSSLRRHREAEREAVAAEVKSKFKASTGSVVIHWDGKLVEEDGKKIDRLPVIASTEKESQLLYISRLESGSGKAQADAVVAAVKSWELQERVCALCFDTTSSNTGQKNGACALIEKSLNKELLHLACRHHIAEIMLKSVYETCMGPSTGPDEPLFTALQGIWDQLDQKKIRTGNKDRSVMQAVRLEKDSIVQFAENQLQVCQPRDDYEEFLELVLIFLGETPPKGLRFRQPGAHSSARWMSKVLYALKLWMLRDQLKGTACQLSKEQEEGLKEVCVFIVKIYVKYWFSVPNPPAAPRTDLELVQNLLKYQSVKKSFKISTVALKKIIGHLWYISEELIGLSLFDPLVPVDVKRKIVKKMRDFKGGNQRVLRLNVKMQDVQKAWHAKSLENFASQKSVVLFERLGLSHDFLNVDPNQWQQNHEWQTAFNIVSSALRVTNDAAERAVKLMKEFHQKFSKNEDQKQAAFQMVSYYRKKFPSINVHKE